MFKFQIKKTPAACHCCCCYCCCLLSLLPSQIIKQVNKLIYVKDVSDITSVPYVARELMLVKVGQDLLVLVWWGLGRGGGTGCLSFGGFYGGEVEQLPLHTLPLYSPDYG